MDHNTIWGRLYQEFPTDRTEISHNTIYGGFSLGDGSATLVGNTITKAEGSLTISVYADESDKRRLTLTDNVIFGHEQPLWFEGPLTLAISGNQIDTDTPGTVALECNNTVTVKTDGTNTLRNPRSWVKCDGLPPAPETNPF